MLITLCYLIIVTYFLLFTFCYLLNVTYSFLFGRWPQHSSSFSLIIVRNLRSRIWLCFPPITITTTITTITPTQIMQLRTLTKALLVSSNLFNIKLHTENQPPNFLNSGDSYEEDIKIRIWKTTLQYFQLFLSTFLLIRLE